MNYIEAVAKIDTYKRFEKRSFKYKKDDSVRYLQFITAMPSNDYEVKSASPMNYGPHIENIIDKDLKIVFVFIITNGFNVFASESEFESCYSSLKRD